VDGAELTPGEEVLERLDAALAASPADETEIVWHEVARAAAEEPAGSPAVPPARERNLLVRVYERGRLGIYRTGAGSAGELEDAVRQALAQAKVDPPPVHRPPLTPKGPPLEGPADGHDPGLAALTPEAAAAMLAEGLERDERSRLSWAEARVVVANSRGLRRTGTVTAVSLEVRSGEGAGAGRAAASARTLAGLAAGEVGGRARALRAGGAAAGDGGALLEPGGDGAPAIVLAPEAVARLVELLNHYALSARSFHDRTSCLLGAVGQPALDPRLSLTDRPEDPAGMPFPFDFFGAAKEPVTLVEGGVLRTPAADSSLAPDLGLPPLHLAVGPDDARAGNLFLTAAGGRDLDELLQAADDGIWIGWLDAVRCFDPPTLRFRAHARGLRAIRGGALGGALPGRPWEASLPRLLARVAGVGREAVCLAAGDGVLEAVVAPALALPAGAAA
jgi:predicted Zn-dependent protease